jgi:hypothetical protein
VRPHLPRATPLVQVTSSPAGTTWMNKIDQGNVGLIEWTKLWSLGSMGPLLWPINHHNRHSKAILSVPERRRCIPHLPTAMRTETDTSYRPSTASGARIRRVQVERRWIIGPAKLPHPTAPMKMGPHAQPTSLPIKGASHPLERIHIAGASHFHSFVHLE